ncbi:hypothetical protein ACO0LD_10325 [Undibacterium sp. Ji83W]|uniref:hypothetical protein n=1 Tax=Undibacterium sp. Ji83W TaxID=3413043 RepID=UPI003BF06B06
MQEKTISKILYVSGTVTMLAGLQFIAPTLFLQASGMQVGDVTGLFFARHWGLMAFVVGALIIYAVRQVQARRAILLAAAVEKLGLVIMVAINWAEPALQGLHIAALFDGACVVLYLIYLLAKLPPPPAQT